MHIYKLKYKFYLYSFQKTLGHRALSKDWDANAAFARNNIPSMSLS